MHALMGRCRVRLLLAPAVSVLVVGFSMLSMLGRMQFIRQAYDWAGTASLGDAVLWLFMGHPSLPAAGWMSVWCTVSVMALIDIQGTGEFDQGIVAAGSRCGAWVAYACTAALLAVLTYILMIAACLMWSVLGGLPPRFPQSRYKTYRSALSRRGARWETCCPISDWDFWGRCFSACSSWWLGSGRVALHHLGLRLRCSRRPRLRRPFRFRVRSSWHAGFSRWARVSRLTAARRFRLCLGWPCLSCPPW